MSVKTASQRSRLFDSLNALADEISTTKQAAANGNLVKKAGPTPPDPGGYQGPTSHPVKDITNNTQTASEGARSSENSSDVKADQGAPSVDSSSEATHGSQDKVQLNIGTEQAATGEAPGVERDFKGTKDDPGTTSPVSADNIGEKYSSVHYKVAYAQATALANTILADLANGFGTKLAGHQGQTQPQSQQQGSQLLKAANNAVAQHQQQAPAAFQQGYELAAMLGIQKEAAEAGVEEVLAQTIKDAQVDADLFGAFYTTFQEHLIKRAMGDEGGEGEDHSQPGDAASGAGPGGSGGEGGEGGDPLGGAGGASLGDLLGGGGATPMEGGGGDPLGGAPVGEEEALAELAAALDELGIPLEALAAAGGGEGGGMPPEGGMPPGGGLPPEAAGGLPPMPGAEGGMPPGEGAKLAHAVRRYKQAGHYRLKAASTPRQRALRDTMREHICELMGFGK